jgi:hypothetical protein
MVRTLRAMAAMQETIADREFTVSALGQFAEDHDCDIEGRPIYPQHLRDLDYMYRGWPSMTAGWSGPPETEVVRIRKAYA